MVGPSFPPRIQVYLSSIMVRRKNRQGAVGEEIATDSRLYSCVTIYKDKGEAGWQGMQRLDMEPESRSIAQEPFSWVAIFPVIMHLMS